MDTNKRITKIFNSSDEIKIDDNSKIIIMSDVHRGDGSWNDSFARNQNVFFAALTHYYNENFTYIELGDGDELWELKNPKDIIREHKDVFWLMSKFYQENRFYMLYGNHDIEKSNEDYLEENYYYFYDEREDRNIPLFENIKVHEGLILNYMGNKILLVHGHQVDFINYDIWPITRFLVRYIWKPLELFGINDITRTAKNYKKRYSVAKKLTEWVIENNHPLIAGHNHRPMFSDVRTPLYFNDGSCVHPRCITGIEIVNGIMVLIKWSIKPNHKGQLHVVKDILAGPNRLEEYFK